MSKKKKNKKQITRIHLNTLYHFYIKHRNLMTEFRAWFVCRHILDPTGSGRVDKNKLLGILKGNHRHLLRECKSSNMFHYVGDKIYYLSWIKLCKKHKLRYGHGKCRYQQITQEIYWLIANNTRFKSFIVRCYAESDINTKSKAKRKITLGRISYAMLAEKFNISSRTAETMIKISNARKISNIRCYPWINIETPLSNWLLQNMDKVIDGKIMDKVEDNPGSYYLKKTRSRNILCRRSPNFYRFTGLKQVRLSHGSRGQRSSSFSNLKTGHDPPI